MPAYLLARPVVAECSTCPRHPLFPVIPRGFGARTHGCGKPLRRGEVTGVERRQVIGIPPVKAEVSLNPQRRDGPATHLSPAPTPATLPGFELRSTDRDVV